jgi:hypothetical protein
MRVIRLAAIIVAGALGMMLLTASAAVPGSWTIDFEGLSEGSKPTSVSLGSGISGTAGLVGSVGVSADGLGAMIFDSDCSGASCSGEDPDLGVNLGNVLIRTEDDNALDPDDFAGPALFTFDFSGIGLVTVDSVTVIDTEVSGGQIEAFGPGPVSLGTVPVGLSGDGSSLVVNVGIEGVETLTIQLNDSGAVDNIAFSVPSESGWMTGGGNITDGGRGRNAVPFSTHGFIIRCDGSHANFQYNDHINGGSFHLESVTSVVCTDDPALNPHPPAADFDTLTLIGTGRWNPASGPTIEATVIVTLTDDGQPGTGDYFDILVFNGGVLSDVDGFLTVGNHQAH